MSAFPAPHQFNEQYRNNSTDERRGVSSRHGGDRSLHEVEVAPFIGEQTRNVSPVREIQPQQHAFHTPYRTNRYNPHLVQQIEPATEYKHVQQSSYPVSSSIDHDTKQQSESVYLDPKKPSLRERYPGWFGLLQGLLLFVVVGAILAVPIIITADARDSREGDNDTRQTRNLVYYIFLVLLTTWGMTGGFYLIAVALPYIYYAVAHFVNPAHKKYWRVFVMMRRPITLLFAVVSGYVSLTIWFWENDQISGFNNAKGETVEDQEVNQTEYANTIATTSRILLYFVLWAGAYFLEKILVAYMTIHYHYRANHAEIQRSKKTVEVIAELFEYSNKLYPRGSTMFAVEDHVIYAARKSEDSNKHYGSSTAAFIDKVSGNFIQAFGVVFGSDSKSHWLAPRSTYTLVTRALEQPASSAALAKRLWMSLASESSDVLTLQDMKDAYGPKQTKQALESFKVLDENENGDIRLDELVPSIVEAGRKRNDIYAGMANMTHVVNTLDWIAIGWLGLVMIGLVLISEIDLLKQLKELIGFAALGLGFVVGRTVNEVVQGAIFTILDHPYDVGDVVEIYTLGEGIKCLLSVKRISLLYTVFTEVGSGKQVQYSNMRCKIKRISNISRSGKNREAITFGIDFTTPFNDIQLLRQELQNFISAPENSRDYYPDLALRVTSLADLNRLELRVSVLHKSNWSNDGLRATRSSRLHCAIVDAVRRVPIGKPGGLALGNEAKPAFTVMLNETEAATKVATATQQAAAKRLDYVQPAPEPLVRSNDAALTIEELQARDDAARKAEELAAANAAKAQTESDARIALMGLRTDLGERNTTATSTGIELVRSDGHSRFEFISGAERGLRPSKRISSDA